LMFHVEHGPIHPAPAAVPTFFDELVDTWIDHLHREDLGEFGEGFCVRPTNARGRAIGTRDLYSQGLAQKTLSSKAKRSRLYGVTTLSLRRLAVLESSIQRRLAQKPTLISRASAINAAAQLQRSAPLRRHLIHSTQSQTAISRKDRVTTRASEDHQPVPPIANQTFGVPRPERTSTAQQENSLQQGGLSRTVATPNQIVPGM